MKSPAGGDMDIKAPVGQCTSTTPVKRCQQQTALQACEYIAK